MNSNNKAQHIVAIDFGTSSTFISTCPVDRLMPSTIKGILPKKSEGGVETAILYRAGKEPLIGSMATEEWGNIRRMKNKDYGLKVHFKPEISTSLEARQAAIDFMGQILFLSAKNYTPLSPEQNKIYFGVPSEADDRFQNAIRDIALKAGYGEVSLIHEPIGALFYHLSRRDITASDAQKGVLVIDYGGGTCDFSFLKKATIIASWGDMHLGGRLFDDLFFQWFIDANSNAIRIMEEEKSEYFIHWYRCRELKESFSGYMSYDRSNTWTGNIPGYGSLKDITWDEFVERAREYRPTSQFLEYLKETKNQSPILSSDNSIDLFLWFRDLLISGLKENHISKNDIQKIILTGGSCLWPFVPELVQEALNINEDSIFRSEEPYEVIALGMSLEPALKRKNERAREALSEDLPRFMEENIRFKILEPLIGDLTSKISRRSAHIIFQDKVHPLLNEFRSKGGTINDLERTIAREVSSSTDSIHDYIKEQIEDAARRLPYEIMKAVADWFAKEEVYFVGESKYIYTLSRGLTDDYNFNESLDAQLFNSIEKIVYGLITVITASICGGSGLAIIMSGPIGLLIGGAIGAFIVRYGFKRAKDQIKEKNLRPSFAKILLSEKSIDRTISKGEENFSKHIEENTRRELKKVSEDVMHEARLLIEREISSISALSQLGEID